MKKKDKTLFRLISYTRPYTLLMLIALLSALVSVAVTLLIPVLTGDAINYMLEGNVDFDSVFRYIYIL